MPDMQDNAPSHMTRVEIVTLFKTAKRVARYSAFDLLMAPAAHAQGRLLVVTSAAVGNAPARNKIRRRIKAIFHEEKLFARGYDCIVIVKAEGVTLSYDQIKELLISGFALADKKMSHPTS